MTDASSITSDPMDHVIPFWDSLERRWPLIYAAIKGKKMSDAERVLQLLHFFSGTLTDHIDFEVTIGQVNNIYDQKAEDHVELYISPRLLKDNVKYVEALYAAKRNLPNLHVCKYRCYNEKSDKIATITYPEYEYNYNDFGIQTFKQNVKQINIVMWVRKKAADALLEKKMVTFVDPDKKKPDTKLEKWLPKKTNVVDVMLTNVIGEYNLVHRVGYIEFLPEGDPLIKSGSVFTELADLQKDFQFLDKLDKVPSCQTCERKSYQCNLLTCSRCKQVLYCNSLCQRINYPVHKKMCKIPVVEHNPVENTNESTQSSD